MFGLIRSSIGWRRAALLIGASGVLAASVLQAQAAQTADVVTHVVTASRLALSHSSASDKATVLAHLRTPTRQQLNLAASVPSAGGAWKALDREILATDKGVLVADLYRAPSGQLRTELHRIVGASVSLVDDSTVWATKAGHIEESGIREGRRFSLTNTRDTSGVSTSTCDDCLMLTQDMKDLGPDCPPPIDAFCVGGAVIFGLVVFSVCSKGFHCPLVAPPGVGPLSAACEFSDCLVDWPVQLNGSDLNYIETEIYWTYPPASIAPCNGSYQVEHHDIRDFTNQTLEDRFTAAGGYEILEVNHISDCPTWANCAAFVADLSSGIVFTDGSEYFEDLGPGPKIQETGCPGEQHPVAG